jgi:hypothetical protein
MSVGVTVGSGGVAEDNTPTPLLQNSYYLSFSLGTHDRIGVEMGGSTFMQERLVPERRPGSGGFGKGKSADDTGRTVALVSSEPGVSMVSQRAPQPITYGGVFYDRRLPINTTWDLCGRVTFGATDGAIVSGVRAYAAFSPTPNVTLTLGVGGSTLFNLTKRVDPSSVNYGVYYGVETGF